MTDLSVVELVTYLESEISILGPITKTLLKEDETDPSGLHIRGVVQAYQSLVTDIEAGRFDVKIAQVPLEDIEVKVTNRVQAHGMDTSWEAAVAQTPEKARKFYFLIYVYLMTYGPHTDEEIEQAFTKRGIAHSVSGLRARRSELAQRGWVKASGDKRPSINGSPMNVWEAVPEHTSGTSVG